MAIAFDAATSGGYVTSTSMTYSHTVGAGGSNRLLVVGVDVFNSADTVTGITYAGISLTKIVHITSSGNSVTNHLYYLLNPATGANNVVVSLSVSNNVASGCASYTGIKQSGQPDSSATAQKDGGEMTFTTTTVADNSWTVLWVGHLGTVAYTPGAGTTERVEPVFASLNDSNAAITPAGSSNLITTAVTDAGQYSGVIASFAPAVAVAVGANSLLSLMGVGN